MDDVTSQIITALRNSPSWNDSILFLTYDENGGYYDHVMPPAADQGDASSFDQLGFRVPLVAVSPFAKPHYVSHVVNSHTSFLALIEKRFGLAPLTARDAAADTFEDMFDFDGAPSLAASLNATAPLPQQPPAFDPGDNGCPF